MKDLENRLKADSVTYPCFIIARGPENPYRTKYRAEHGGEYADGVAGHVGEAVAIIKRCSDRYYGPMNKIDIKAICINNGEITEVQV